jgi:probable HAF family extracellular repeat protein
MISHTVLRNLTSVFLTVCCAIGIATAHSETYTLTDLGVLPNESASISAAINRQGQVTGTSGDSAFRSDSGAVMQDIGSPVSRSRGFAISVSGQVVGDSTFGESEVSHAALFENGSDRDLTGYENPQLFSRANGINASGQVVGIFQSSSNGDHGRAFITNLFRPAKGPALIDMGTLGGSYAQAWAINDSGFVTGNSETGDYLALGIRITHAFLWNPATKEMVDLGALDGYYSYGTSINANNHVVGYSTVNGSDNRTHAFIYDGIGMRDLGSLDPRTTESDRSLALGVNSTDQVVGYSYIGTGSGIKDPRRVPPRQVAFIYSQGVMRDLNTLMTSETGNYQLISATGINDQGQITAIALEESGNDFHAVLLMPAHDLPAARPSPGILKSGSLQGSKVPAAQLPKTQSGKISAK